MSQYPESIANLVGLAQEAAQQKNYAQAKKYFQEALKLEPSFTALEDYFDLLQRTGDFGEARQLLADFEQVFLRQGSLADYWQKLLAVQDYLTFDQSLKQLSFQHYQLSTVEKKGWSELHQQLLKVEIEPAKVAQVTADLLQAATIKTGQNVTAVFKQLQLLTPSAYVQVAQPTLLSPTLDSEVRVKLINDISLLADSYTVTIYWRGEMRQLNSATLSPMQYVPALEQFTAEIAQNSLDQQTDEATQQFALSNLLTYVLLTYPFCEEELQPHELWREFLISGKIPLSTNIQAVAQLTYWQQQELNLLNNLNS